MRIAPIGLARSSRDLPALVDAVVEATIMSHDTNVAVAGASLVAAVISSALDGPAGTVTYAALMSHLEVGFGAAELGRGRGEQVVAASVVRRSRLAVDIARAAPDDETFLAHLYDVVDASMQTAETVPAAVGLLVRGGANPVRVATLAANLGGDTDTIGAIATGMAGAISGLSAIPSSLVGTLVSVNGIDPETLARGVVGLRR